MTATMTQEEKKAQEAEARHNIATNVRRLINLRDLTQEQLAGYVGVTQGCISKILNGMLLPNALLLREIAGILGVHSDDLLDPPKRKAS